MHTYICIHIYTYNMIIEFLSDSLIDGQLRYTDTHTGMCMYMLMYVYLMYVYI